MDIVERPGGGRSEQTDSCAVIILGGAKAGRHEARGPLLLDAGVGCGGHPHPLHLT